MGFPEFSKDSLAQMRLSQLRELAKRLGIWRYSAMLRDQLVTAIHGRSPQAGATDAPGATPSPRQLAVPPLTEVVSEVGAGLSSLEESSVPVPAELTSASGDTASWVMLMPQDHQWATVRWGISAEDRDRLQAMAAQEMALRLTDVTGSVDGGAHPHTLQQVTVPVAATEWYLPVPLGDRDYKVELGVRTAEGGWLALAVSAVVRMPAEGNLPAAPLAGFSLVGDLEETAWPTPSAMPGLHERLYQQASAGRVRLGLGSEAFQDHGGPALAGGAGDQLSGAGLWASGREASGAGLLPRQRSFWLVADAELIVYGATDPSATLTVGEEVLPLASDGTFRLHTSFPNGDQEYPIRALAADGEQKRSITLEFQRTTPHAKVNTKEAAVAEWF
jgi:hypothetical protein